jgi:hypothetical protein
MAGAESASRQVLPRALGYDFIKNVEKLHALKSRITSPSHERRRHLPGPSRRRSQGAVASGGRAGTSVLGATENRGKEQFGQARGRTALGRHSRGARSAHGAVRRLVATTGRSPQADAA